MQGGELVSPLFPRGGWEGCFPRALDPGDKAGFHIVRRFKFPAALAFFVCLTALVCAPGHSYSEEKEKEFVEKVFLTKKEVLEAAFPGADRIDTEKKWLTDSQRQAIGKICLQTIEDQRITYYVGIKGGKPMGYVTIDHVIGKSYPITFMVALNTDGTVRDVEVMVYREPHGWEVRFKSFLSQFFGKDAGADFRNINSITGATLSVRSMVSGVSKAVAAYKVLYLDKTP
ncbi:MAG: FMN-binding protein [Nitrospinae bacterium]|nr:FMN-binding protein [Nitrospinota bacterium]